MLMTSMQLHKGAIFTTGMESKWIFTGGWDKILKVQVHTCKIWYLFRMYTMKFRKFFMLTHLRVHAVMLSGI